MATVDQHGQLDRARPAEVAQRVQGGPDGAAGVEDVVDEHDQPAVHPAGRLLGRLQRPHAAQPQVVPVQGDVERADRHVDALEGADAGGQPAGQRGAAGRDAEDDGVAGTAGLLQDLVGDAVDHAGHVGRVEQRTAHQGPPSPPHGTGR